MKKYVINSGIRIGLSILGSFIYAPILYVILVIAYLSFLFYEPQYDFEEQKWFTDKNNRFKMSDDLIKSEILKNRTKGEIVILIGKPDTENLDVWTYDLGTSVAGFGWQSNSLVLTFNNGKVSEVNKIEIVD